MICGKTNCAVNELRPQLANLQFPLPYCFQLQSCVETRKMYFDVAGIKYKKQSTVQVHGNLFHENIKWTLMSLATAIMLDRRVADRHKQKDGQTC